jgi:hypothetical protein
VIPYLALFLLKLFDYRYSNRIENRIATVLCIDGCIRKKGCIIRGGEEDPKTLFSLLLLLLLIL